MDGQRHERRHHFRGKARPGRVLPVRYQAAAPGATSDAWTAAETRNIGVGGAFIVTPSPLAVGAKLTVELKLPQSAGPALLPAIVRWTSPTAGGMGVQFVGVDTDILLEMNDYFATLTAI